MRPPWRTPTVFCELSPTDGKIGSCLLLEGSLFMEEITASELKAKLDAGEDNQIIDVRQPDEYGFARIEGAVLIPLAEIINRMGEIDDTRDTVVHCHTGFR